MREIHFKCWGCHSIHSYLDTILEISKTRLIPCKCGRFNIAKTPSAMQAIAQREMFPEEELELANVWSMLHSEADGIQQSIHNFLEETNAYVAKKICPGCFKKLDEPVFRDNQSKREFRISGLCQSCQDDVFGEGS